MKLKIRQVQFFTLNAVNKTHYMVCFSSAGMYVYIWDNVCVESAGCSIGQVNYVLNFSFTFKIRFIRMVCIACVVRMACLHY